MTWLRRALGTVTAPVLRFGLRLIPVPDPWERLSNRIPVHMLGSGSRKDFGWYFEGDSAVCVESLQEIQRWLSGCEYVSDHRLFQERDFWQHPRTFEQIRRGDCEDFALWAWRKLIELRYDADFVVGRCGVDPVTGLARARFEGHAWVMFRRDGCTYLYEPTLRDETLAVQVVETVRHRYVPEFGVGPTRRPFGFAGYLLSMREQHLPREERPVGGDGHAT